MNPIVFVSTLDAEQQQLWLHALKQGLPDETIYLAEQVDINERDNIDIAIVANPDPIELSKFSKLLWIQSLWAGVEKLVSELSSQKSSVKLVRLIDPQLAKTMAESVLAWTLYLQRQMYQYAKQQQAKYWHQLPCIASSDLRVCVLGAGELGLAAIEALKKLDYQVNCWSRSTKNIKNVTHYTGESGFNEVLQCADILINLLPLTEQTHKILNYQTMSQLPKGAQLINFSRAGVVDTDALLHHLNNKHIEHAVLDVFDIEPLNKASEIWHHPKITVLPHISAPTNMQTATSIVAKNITRYRNSGVLPRLVNLKTGY